MDKVRESIKREALDLWRLTPLIIATILGWELGKIFFA